jgi:hypothetical protein
MHVIPVLGMVQIRFRTADVLTAFSQITECQKYFSLKLTHPFR